MCGEFPIKHSQKVSPNEGEQPLFGGVCMYKSDANIGIIAILVHFEKNLLDTCRQLGPK